MLDELVQLRGLIVPEPVEDLLFVLSQRLVVK